MSSMCPLTAPLPPLGSACQPHPVSVSCTARWCVVVGVVVIVDAAFLRPEETDVVLLLLLHLSDVS